MNMAEDTGQRESRHTTRYLSLCVMIGILFVPASTNTVVSEKLSLLEARASCQTEHNGDLYVPGPMHLAPTLPPNTWYWIGALKTSEWKWTDNSSPFRHIGYLEQSRVNKGTSFNLPGNSVAQCYSNCYLHTYFGLSETSCYCLGDIQLPLSTTGKGSTCPGNLAENCGNTNELFVYKTDIDFSIQDNTQCVFGSWQKTTSKMELLFFSADCRIKFPAVCLDNSSGKARERDCSDGLCVNRTKYQWLDARNNCNLVNGTDVNKLKFLTDWKTNYPRFWIGLNRTSTKTWIDGTEFIQSYKADGQGSQLCLAVFTSKPWIHEWKQCSKLYPSLCDSNTLYTTDRITTINQLETSTPHRLSSNDRITTINKLETSTSHRMSNGLYIGFGLGVALLVVLLIVVLVVLKRTRQQKRNAELRVRYAAFERPNDQINEQPYEDLHVYVETVHM